MTIFYHLAALAAAVFYVILLRRLVSRALPDFTALFIYIAVLFLTTAIDYAFVFNPRELPFNANPRIVYYVNDLLRQFMVYVIVISLIYQALTLEQRQKGVGRWVIVAATCLALVFVLVSREEHIARWMTNVVRNLSLVAMLLNLMLWLLLMRRRASDKTLLLVTTGLGLQMAGEAIGQSLRLMSKAAEPFGNVVLVLSHLLCLWVWYHTFRPAPQAQPRIG
jgi:hypothetical protein